MSALPRVQLALSVSDVDAAVDFYSRLFGAEPHKRRPGYANFALESPPLKLVLIEDAEGAGGLNHLGVEVADSTEVSHAQRRMTEAGLDPRDELAVVCCHALQDKVWVTDPDGAGWEVYTITDDNPDENSLPVAEGSCCAS
ncbi:MAG: ArsI/CadI family heavy metal resistance metalloenzyme [Actinomycetes bacterium]